MHLPEKNLDIMVKGGALKKSMACRTHLHPKSSKQRRWQRKICLTLASLSTWKHASTFKQEEVLFSNQCGRTLLI